MQINFKSLELFKYRLSDIQKEKAGLNEFKGRLGAKHLII